MLWPKLCLALGALLLLMWAGTGRVTLLSVVLLIGTLLLSTLAGCLLAHSRPRPARSDEKRA